MIAADKRIAELSEIQGQLPPRTQTAGPDPVQSDTPVPPKQRLLQARLRDIATQMFSDGATAKSVHDLIASQSASDQHAALDFMLAASKREAEQTVIEPAQSGYLDELVTRAFLRSKLVNRTIWLFAAIAVFLLSLLTAGTVLIYDQTAAAGDILAKSKQSIETTQGELDTNIAMLDRIERGITEAREELDKLNDRIQQTGLNLNGAAELAERVRKLEKDTDAHDRKLGLQKASLATSGETLLTLEAQILPLQTTTAALGTQFETLRANTASLDARFTDQLGSLVAQYDQRTAELDRAYSDHQKNLKDSAEAALKAVETDFDARLATSIATSEQPFLSWALLRQRAGLLAVIALVLGTLALGLAVLAFRRA